MVSDLSDPRERERSDRPEPADLTKKNRDGQEIQTMKEVDPIIIREKLNTYGPDRQPIFGKNLVVRYTYILSCSPMLTRQPARRPK